MIVLIAVKATARETYHVSMEIGPLQFAGRLTSVCSLQMLSLLRYNSGNEELMVLPWRVT
jgi:hypothetical protein